VIDMVRHAICTSLVLAALTQGQVAYAGDAALAEALFREGRALMDQGNHAAACPKLSESFVQDPATGTLFALAVCQQESGKTASAWASYAEVISRSKQEGRSDRETAARERMAALEPGLSRLKVEVSPEVGALPGLTVKRNGALVGQAAWGVAAPVDPGEHVVEASAPGKRPFVATVMVGPDGEMRAVGITALEDESAAAATGTPSTPPGETAAWDGGEPSGGSSLRTLGLVVGGMGLVGLGVGSYFGLRAMSLHDDSNAGGRCDTNNECTEEGLRLREDAIAASTLSTIGFVAGGLLTAAGITLFIVGAPDGAGTAARLEAVPVIGPREGAMSLRGRF
jgi:hypothetical protein